MDPRSRTVPASSRLLRALEQPAARVLALLAAAAMVAGWVVGDRVLHAPHAAGFDAWWLAFLGLVILCLALVWVWLAVFRGRQDRHGMTVSVVGLLVCTSGAVLVGAAGLVLELFVRAGASDSIPRIALRSLWHAASAFSVLLVLSPVTLRALGSLPLRSADEEPG